MDLLFSGGITHWWNYAPVWGILLVTAIPIIVICLLMISRSSVFRNRLCWIVFIVSFFLILWITIFSRNPGSTPTADLTPFSFIERGQDTPTIFREYWMNVYLFIPLGLAAPAVFKNRYVSTILFGFVLSIFIEGVQYFFALGLCETDDVIANTLGCAIGVAVYSIAMKIRDKII